MNYVFLILHFLIYRYAYTWFSDFHVYCLNTACPPCHHHNGFMATGARRHNLVRLHVADILESKIAQVTDRKPNIINKEENSFTENFLGIFGRIQYSRCF